MRTMILAALAALLVLASPAKASFNTDDRYFDSRAPVAASKKIKMHKTAHQRHVKRVPRTAPRITTPEHNRLTAAGGVAPPSPNRARRSNYNTELRFVSTETHILGGRPVGCPSRFCGCGASIHLFGRIIPFLNLAANWLRFPRAEPAPKMAAARRGHVFVLEQHIAGKVWMVFDANSGGRATRMHARSIAGYTIVNPRAGPS